jgi:hypothetical protein
MELHGLIVVVAGTGGVLLGMAGVWVIVRPRRLWSYWFAFERRWRRRRFAGGWTDFERSLRRRGYFWVPRDIDLRAPEDVYAYVLSDRFWRSGYAWFVRGLCWYAGLLLIFFAFVVLGLGLPGLP